jgi:hypothetical protein
MKNKWLVIYSLGSFIFGLSVFAKATPPVDTSPRVVAVKPASLNVRFVAPKPTLMSENTAPLCE